jgi:hypothetical protein
MTLWTKPQNLASQIFPKCQLKQDIILDILNIPYFFLILELDMWLANKRSLSLVFINKNVGFKHSFFFIKANSKQYQILGAFAHEHQ